MLFVVFFILMYSGNVSSSCSDITMGPIASCVKYPFTCNTAGSWRCSCTKNCTQVSDYNTQGGIICVNVTTSLPKQKLIYPHYCFSNRTSDVDCNIDGKGTYCPIGCSYQNHGCTKTENNARCHPFIDWSCPQGCSYDKPTNSCLPLNDNSICGLIESTLKCPIGCRYINDRHQCVHDNPNYVCRLEKKLICPIKCQLNDRGDKCIGEDYDPRKPYYISNYVCNYTQTPKCPKNCHWDLTYGICKSENPSDQFNICEPFGILTCPHGQFNLQGVNFQSLCNGTESCGPYPPIYQYTPCDYGCDIWYPLRLKDQFAHITCKYSDVGNCENKSVGKYCCGIN
jgi:hypothetical protein